MKITKKQLLAIIKESLDIREGFNLSPATQRILPALINLKKFDSVEDFLSRVSLISGGNYKSLEMTLKIDDKIAGYVRYKILTREDTSYGAYCRPEPFKDRPTYMMVGIGRDESFKGYGVGRLLGFLSVCYINSNNGTVTSDRNTSDFAAKELIDSLEMIGAKKSKSFDYVGWLLGTIYRVFHKEMRFNPGPLEYHYDSAVNSPKSGAKGARHNRKLEAEYNEEMQKLIYDFLSAHQPLTQYLSDDCFPSLNLTFGSEDDSIFDIYNRPSFKQFLEKYINLPTEKLQNDLNADERVQGYTFTLNETMINSGMEIINAIVDNDAYEGEEFDDELDKGYSVFDQVYQKTVAEPGVGTINIDDELDDV